MVMFHSYVELPKGILHYLVLIRKGKSTISATAARPFLRSARKRSRRGVYSVSAEDVQNRWPALAIRAIQAPHDQLIGFRENYRKIPYFMGKSMVSCRFSLKSTHWHESNLASLKSRQSQKNVWQITAVDRPWLECRGSIDISDSESARICLVMVFAVLPIISLSNSEELFWLKNKSIKNSIDFLLMRCTMSCPYGSASVLLSCAVPVACFGSPGRQQGPHSGRRMHLYARCWWCGFLDFQIQVEALWDTEIWCECDVPSGSSNMAGWKIPELNGGFIRKIADKWSNFPCHVWLLTFILVFFNTKFLGD